MTRSPDSQASHASSHPSPASSSLPASDPLASRLRDHLAPHPRLLLDRGGEQALQQRLARDAQLGQLWRAMLEEADGMCLLPPPQRQLKGRRLLAVARQVLRGVLTLGLAYRLTQQPRYAQAARQLLLAVAGFPDWNPSHFLDVAEMTAALAIGYDWLHDSLSEADRTVLRLAIVEKGLNPSFAAPHGWITSTNNWNQVCHGGLALGALAVAEQEPGLCARTLNRALENVPQAMKHYAPDGAYPEGPMYWSYGTTYNVMLIAALESALGSDFGLGDQPGFLASADYLLHVTAPSGLFFNYADCRADSGLPPSPALFWMAARRQEPYLLFHQRKALAASLATGLSSWGAETARFSPLLLLWAGGPEQPPPPPATHYVGRGAMPIAVHRSSWHPDATFLAIKGGSPSVSHAHMDVGSFVLESQGVRWACDLGMQDYHSLESIGVNLWNAPQGGTRWSIFRLGPRSHNILMVDDREQDVAGHAPIFYATAHSTLVESSPVYAGQLQAARRLAALSEDGAARIQDEIQALPERGATVRWAMMTHAQVKLIDDHTAQLTQEDRHLRLKVTASYPVRLAIFATDPAPQPYDAPNPGATLLGFHLELPPGAAATLRVDFLPLRD